MTRLIADLLDYTRSRLGAGIPIERATCDIGRICKDALDSIQASYPEHRFALCAAVICQPTSTRRSCSRRSAIFSPMPRSTGGRAQVGLSASGTPDAIVLKVSNGARLSPRRPCVQCSSLTHLQNSRQPDERSQTSIGPGRFIVREVVNGHSGALTVQSSLKEGIVFTVRLPKSGPKLDDVEG